MLVTVTVLCKYEGHLLPPFVFYLFFLISFNCVTQTNVVANKRTKLYCCDVATFSGFIHSKRYIIRNTRRRFKVTSCILRLIKSREWFRSLSVPWKIYIRKSNVNFFTNVTQCRLQLSAGANDTIHKFMFEIGNLHDFNQNQKFSFIIIAFHHWSKLMWYQTVHKILEFERYASIKTVAKLFAVRNLVTHKHHSFHRKFDIFFCFFSFFIFWLSQISLNRTIELYIGWWRYWSDAMLLVTTITRIWWSRSGKTGFVERIHWIIEKSWISQYYDDDH